MPYCNRCGAKHSKFDETCPGCGNPIAAAMPKRRERESPTGPEHEMTGDDWLDERVNYAERMPRPEPVRPEPPVKREPSRDPDPFEAPKTPEPATEAPSDIPPEFRDDFEEFPETQRPQEVSFDDGPSDGPMPPEFGYDDDGPEWSEPGRPRRRPAVEFESEPDMEFEPEDQYEGRGPPRRSPVKEEDVEWGGPPRGRDPFDRYSDRYHDERPPYGPERYEERRGPPPVDDGGGPPRTPRGGGGGFSFGHVPKIGTLVLVLAVIGLLSSFLLPWITVWEEDDDGGTSEASWDYKLEVSSQSDDDIEADDINGTDAKVMERRIWMGITGLIAATGIGAAMVGYGAYLEGSKPELSPLFGVIMGAMVIVAAGVVIYSGTTFIGDGLAIELTKAGAEDPPDHGYGNYSQAGSVIALMGSVMIVLGMVLIHSSSGRIERVRERPKARERVPEPRHDRHPDRRGRYDDRYDGRMEYDRGQEGDRW